MKHLLLLLALSSVFMPEQLFSQYKYPFGPDDKEWYSFSDVNERKAALAIPNDCLNGIRTSELLELCLDYPYLMDFFAYNSSEKGLNALMSDFNGFKELLNREDLMPCLIESIKGVNKTLTDSRNDIEDIGSYTLRCCVLFILMDRTLSVDNLTEEQALQLTETINALSTIEVMQESVALNVLQHVSQRLTSSTYYDNVYFDWIDACFSLVERNTPNQCPVYAYKLISSDYSSGEKSSYRSYTISHYPGVSIVDEATRKYNCHAYAWHITQGNNDDKLWIGHGAISHNPESCPDPYWETGSYYEVDESEATIVTYMKYGIITHSAIRIDSNEYLSKWGALPLVRHAPTNVPSDYGLPYKYYKRYYRPSLSGPALFNTSATYSVSDLPSGYSVSWSFSEPSNLSNFSTNYPNYGQCSLTRNQSYNIHNANLSANISFAGYNVHSITKAISSYSGFWGQYRINGGTQHELNYPYLVYYSSNCTLEITSPNLVDATISTQGDANITYWSFDQTNGYLRIGMPSSGTLVLTINSSNGTFTVPILRSSSAQSINISQRNSEILITLPIIQNDENFEVYNMTEDYVMVQNVNTREATRYLPIKNSETEIAIPVNGNKGTYLIKVCYKGQEFTKKIVVN